MGMMMNTKEAAEYIGVSAATVRQYVHENGLPVLKFPGRKKWMFRKDLIDKWIEEQSTPQVFVNGLPIEKELFQQHENPSYGKLRMLRP